METQEVTEAPADSGMGGLEEGHGRLGVKQSITTLKSSFVPRDDDSWRISTGGCGSVRAAWWSSEDAVWHSSVTAHVFTADSTLMVGRGLSRMTIAAAAT